MHTRIVTIVYIEIAENLYEFSLVIKMHIKCIYVLLFISLNKQYLQETILEFTVFSLLNDACLII